jgi:hypothetical protein
MQNGERSVAETCCALVPEPAMGLTPTRICARNWRRGSECCKF